MLNIKKVNKEIKLLGIEAEIAKGDGYFYFFGDGVKFCKHTSVFVYRLNQIKLDDWLNEAKCFAKESSDRQDYLASK